MLKLVKKLKLLKGQIRLWVKDKKDKPQLLKNSLKKKLVVIDSSLYKGDATSDALEDRLNTMNNLTNLERMESLELAQKAKIKLSIEGDENSKKNHGIINKQCNNLAIRGIIVDGEWIEDPVTVKNEFLAHFRYRFGTPCKYRLTLDMNFPNKLSIGQMYDLERQFLKVEIKGAVWDYSLNKSPAKLLANHLVAVMGDLVNKVQSAFIANRQILDGPFMLNEIIHWGSILVNGSPTYEFQFYKGLKQGDPLSPFLFILVMESLHLLFHNVVTAGLFNGIVLDSSLKLSHLFYADYVVFIGQWSDSNIFTIIHVLYYFFRASGLRINLHKSKLIGIAVDPFSVEAAANDIGCMALNLPLSYLGINISGHMSRIKAWDNVINKVLCQLSKWKMKSLSIGGRLTLLKSVLGLTPIYYMSMFKAPIHVVIKAIHGDDGKLGSKPTFSSNWTEIIRDIPLLYNKGDGKFSVSSVRSLIYDKILEVVAIGNQSIECDHLNEIGMMGKFVEFISFIFNDKEMIVDN
ncbi:RNA-directed DNA polymerase, eukaryota [Tanacetum coccineum]